MRASLNRSRSSVTNVRFLKGVVTAAISLSEKVVLPITFTSRTNTCTVPGCAGTPVSGVSGTMGSTGLGGGLGRTKFFLQGAERFGLIAPSGRAQSVRRLT